MGKASKWIRNLLMGKRDEKAKEENCAATLSGGIMATPKVRRRWSFKSNAKVTRHKSTSSFDSIFLPKRALLLEYESHAHAAATKIQATYRSYLARRALRALKGLVKLQALARGYLVRKHMNTVLRSMHAVMAIQVRARIHRIQMVEPPPLMVGRRRSCMMEPSASARNVGKQTSENMTTGGGGLRSRSGRVYHVGGERVDHGSRICSSGRLSLSQREYLLKRSSSPSPSPSMLSFTDSSSTTHDCQLEEFSLTMARRDSRRYSPTPQNKHPFIDHDFIPSDSPTLVPNYMINTESSKAKTRSHSEPRQRPKSGTKHKSKRSSSMDGKNDKQNEYPWLSKLYRADRSTDEGDCDSIYSAMAKHMKSSVPFPFEVPPMDMY